MWKDVDGFDKYEINENGEVRNKRTGKILKPYDRGNGYRSCRLYDTQGSHNCYVHRLVALAFVPNPNNYPEVNHIDEDKTNNCVSNLEWCTKSHNVNYGNRNAKVAAHFNIPVIQYSMEGEFIREWPSMRSIQRELGYSQGNISSCCTGFYKQSYGYIWKYKSEE